jgi:hypothetical protein
VHCSDFPGLPKVAPADRNMNIRIVLLAGAMLAFMSPGNTLASIRKCENPTLLVEDEKQLFEAAKLVLPTQTQPMLADRCRWSESAFAWITTKKNTDANGVVRWWISSCARDRYRWTCEPAMLQQLVVASFVVADIAHQVKISFDRQTRPAVAKALVSRALESYASATPPFPNCREAQGQESKWGALRDGHPLPTGDEAIHVTVSSDGKMTETVWFGDILSADDALIGIRLPAGARQKSAPCWVLRES